MPKFEKGIKRKSQYWSHHGRHFALWNGLNFNLSKNFFLEFEEGRKYFLHYLWEHELQFLFSFIITEDTKKLHCVSFHTQVNICMYICACVTSNTHTHALYICTHILEKRIQENMQICMYIDLHTYMLVYVWV